MSKVWQAKLAAYTHDPIDKALILMKLSHEEGSVRLIRKELFGSETIPEELDEIVRKADWFSSAADRPQIPMNLRSKINFAENPFFIHPLSGEGFSLQRFTEETRPFATEALSFDNLKQLIIRRGNGEIDWKKTFLSFWRFGKELPIEGFGVLWRELPADTRSPDHSIWEHLSLTSAFAGAMAEGDDPALLLVSFGPVQGFIAQARTASDLWAGSHILSMIAWEGMKVICEEYGPDAVIFPTLHGVPMVDLWLLAEHGLSEFCEILSKGFKSLKTLLSELTDLSDANPLFIAALPNRFVALVPEGKAEKLARKVEATVRKWCLKKAEDVLRVLGVENNPVANEQIKRQFSEFPEVNWAVVPWRLGGTDGFDDAKLKDVLSKLGFTGNYMDEVLYRILKKEIKVENASFYTPNPGVAYPGLYEALERLHAAVKMERPFSGIKEEGYRCSICGEREWITDNRADLCLPPGKRTNTLWARLHKVDRIVKEGEHLCGWCALKRFWSRIFTEWLREVLPEFEEKTPRKYMVSTHTMALSTSIWNYLAEGRGNSEEAKKAKQNLSKKMKDKDITDGVTLPKKLYLRLKSKNDLEFFKKLPRFLDQLADEDEKREYIKDVEKSLENLFGKRPEAYYAFVLMDGDEMGKWISGKKADLKLGERFHKEVLLELKEKGLKEYINAKRPTSPAWHQAISSALNSFSVHLSRYIVEELFIGKLIYAGGDDLLAMVAVHDLPALMLSLRCAYSGVMPWEGNGNPWRWLTSGTVSDPGLKFGKGYVLLEKSKRLFRVMGEKATASMGAVVAHHKAPLGRVLRILRSMEKRAKNLGRDGFSIALVKRSGGEIWFDGKWALSGDIRRSDMGLLIRTRDILAEEKVSRRAAYILQELLKNAPCEEEALKKLIFYQLTRQGADEQKSRDLSCDVVDAAFERHKEGPAFWISNLFATAEFFAREGRVPIPVGGVTDG